MPESAPSVDAPSSGREPGACETAIGRRAVRLDIWVPTLYAAISCAWIFLSGRLVAALARSSEQHATWELLKGFGFVAVTAGLLHAGLRWALARERSAHLRVVASEARFRAILHSIGDAVITTDEAGQIALLNPTAEALTGWKAEDAVGRPLAEVFQVIDARTRQRVTSPLERMLRGEGVAALGEAPVLVARDGSERPVAESASPVRGSDGRICGIVLVFRDERERKSNEEERKRADEALRRLGAAVEQTPASIVITDETGAIQYVNPAFERTTGYSAAEVLGRTPRVIKSGRHDTEFYRQLWATISSGRVWSGRVVNRAKSGLLFTEDAVIAPVKDGAGLILNYVAVKRDVTEELRLQNQLFEAQKLESVARLAGGIAHDFNNLLTVILSCAEALRHDLASGRAANTEDIDEVRTAGERARELTRQLLAFARRQVFEPVSLDLSALVRDSEGLLRRVLNEDVVLEVALQPDLWPVRCDPGQAEQILLNLVVNARDAVVHAGKLRIETSNQEVTDAHGLLYPGITPGPHVRLAVHDSGMGMSPEVKARLFEPFFTTKPIGQGTGLGLATVHGIVKQSGGFVRVESEPGYGTTFEVLFPRAAEPASPEPTSPSPEPLLLAAPQGRETVLLVEDDPHVRSVTARTLGSGGYEVLVAGNGLEALELVSSHRGPLDLLVTDVIMPGVDGRQLAEAIRRAWPELRVLYVSGHAHDVLGQRGALDSGIDLLPKPYTPVSLLARVRAALVRA